MKKYFFGAVSAAFLVTPAFAATTVEFKRDSGETYIVTLDGEGGAALADGTAMAYNYDPEAARMCFSLPDDTESCVTYAETIAEPKAGDSVRYKLDDGAEGTATIIEITE